MADIVTFQSFLYDKALIPQSALPSTDPGITDAFNWGLNLVPVEFQCASSQIYDLAVYCAGTSYLINWQVDQSNMSYFSDLRKTYNISTFTGGIINSTSDNGTGNARVVPDWAKDATVGDLQNLKDPFGMQLMLILQKYGSLWGLS